MLTLPPTNRTVLGTLYRLRALILEEAPHVEQVVPYFAGVSLEDVWRWLLRVTRYQDDPPMIERIRVPEAQYAALRRGERMAGDCDDMVALAGALLIRLGWDVEIVAQAYDREKTLDHVFLRVHRDGTTTAFDLANLTESRGEFGWEPPREDVTAEVTLAV